ncbi:MAG: hypothetical protein BWY68_00568 [bacterium ADurb.Bin400]|nr:MAG: hypothetical protein BWY68_00568 [bacterium ADurb.Bin400]
MPGVAHAMPDESLTLSKLPPHSDYSMKTEDTFLMAQQERSLILPLVLVDKITVPMIYTALTCRNGLCFR